MLFQLLNCCNHVVFSKKEGYQMKNKRFLAISTAVAISISALAAPASAAPAGFQDAAHKGLQESLDQYAEVYDAGVGSYEEAMKGVNATLDVSLEDSGKAFLGLVAPMDLSWLNGATLSMDATIADFSEAAKMDLLINGATILSMLFQMDIDTMDMLVQVPQISPTYLKGNYTQIMETALAEDPAAAEEIPFTPEMYNFMMKSLFSFLQNPLSSEAITGIMDRYASMVLDSFEDLGAEEAVVTAGDITENATMVTGKLTEIAAYNIVTDVLKTAKDDADIKDILLSYGGDNAEESYAEFVAAIDKLLNDLAEEAPDPESEEYVICRLYVNDDDEVIGSQSAITSYGEEEVFMSCFVPSADNQSALHLEVGESDFILDGKGEITDGLLSGNYLLCAGDEPIANIEVINYDAAAAEEGSFIGTYRITLASDDEEMAFFSAFGLTVNVNTSNVYGGTIALTLDSNGAPLATVTMTAGYGDGAEVLDIASAEPALDMIDGEAMAEYMSSIDIGAIIQSLLDAGVPEDFINGILGMMMGEEAYAGDDAA